MAIFLFSTRIWFTPQVVTTINPYLIAVGAVLLATSLAGLGIFYLVSSLIRPNFKYTYFSFLYLEKSTQSFKRSFDPLRHYFCPWDLRLAHFSCCSFSHFWARFLLCYTTELYYNFKFYTWIRNLLRRFLSASGKIWPVGSFPLTHLHIVIPSSSNYVNFLWLLSHEIGPSWEIRKGQIKQLQIGIEEVQLKSQKVAILFIYGRWL